MGLSTKREAPELGTSGFSPTAEDDRVVLGKYSDKYFFEEDAAVVVEKFTNAHQVVMEVGHYVAALDGELWEEQVTLCQVNARGGTGGANYNLASRGVDVGTGGARGHVEVTCAGVDNVSIGLG